LQNVPSRRRLLRAARIGTRRNPARHRAFSPRTHIEEEAMGKGLLLWLVGVPIPVIILLWLFFGR
jgi:hypothetical protein